VSGSGGAVDTDIALLLSQLTNVTTWDKPEALKTEADMEKAGRWVWAPDATHAFVPAKFIEQFYDGRIELEKEDGSRVTLPKTHVLEDLTWSSLRRPVRDLVMLDVMNQPLILYNLKSRFDKNEIVRAQKRARSSQLCMNAFSSFGSVVSRPPVHQRRHDPDRSESVQTVRPPTRVHARLTAWRWPLIVFFIVAASLRLPLYTPTIIQQYRTRGSKDLAPHIFTIADDAYNALIDFGLGQSIVISGESGAGHY
jgi:hypothetical protein